MGVPSPAFACQHLEQGQGAGPQAQETSGHRRLRKKDMRFKVDSQGLWRRKVAEPSKRPNILESVDFVSVHRATIPPLTRSTVSYINWHNLDRICSAHNVTRWSEPFWDMLAKYAHTTAGGRQNAFWFLWGEFFTFDSTGNVASFRRDHLERYIRVFLGAGMKTIQGAPMVGRRYWGSTDMLLSVQAEDGKEVDARL